MRLLILAFFLTVLSPWSWAQSFVPNGGQWKAGVQYRAGFAGGSLWIDSAGWTLGVFDAKAIHHGHDHGEEPHEIKAHGWRVDLPGAQLRSAEESFHGTATLNYFTGKDPRHWATNLKACAQLTYRSIWPGIDLVFRESGLSLKYDFVVKPGANPETIRMTIAGADGLRVKNKQLELRHSLGTWVEGQPIAWQDVAGERQAVDVAWKVEGTALHFKVGRYNTAYPLVIDPELIFATYTGSTADNWGYTATYGAGGTTYGGGTVYAQGYPTLGPYQSTFAGETDCGITKFSADGTSIIYSTYLGGALKDQPHSLVEAPNGELIILGITGSTNFPVTPTAYDTSYGGGVNFIANQINFSTGSDLFVARLSAAGNALVGSTYLGDTLNDGVNQGVTITSVDAFRGEVILDAQGKIWLTSCTQSPGFPTTAGAPQTALNGFQDAVLVRMNGALTALEFSTFLGGEANEAGFGLALFNTTLYLTGGTNSNTFPTTPGAVITTRPGQSDGFLARYNATTGALEAATYEGTSVNDVTFLLALNDQGLPTVFGTTNGAYTPSPGTISSPGDQIFFRRYNANLTAVDRTAVFGSASTVGLDLSPTAFAIDSCGRTFFSGWGGADATAALPTSANAIRSFKQNNDLYIGVLDPAWSTLLYGTYYGSNLNEHVDGGTSRFDPAGVVHQAICAGCGGTSGFPTTPGVIGPTNGSNNCNLAVLRMDLGVDLLDLKVEVQPDSNCVPFAPVVSNQSVNGQIFWWSADGVTWVQGPTPPPVTISAPGTYTFFLAGRDTLNCGQVDTISYQIVGFDDGSSAQIGLVLDPCDSLYRVEFTNLGGSDTSYFTLNNTPYPGDGPHNAMLPGPGPHRLILEAEVCGGVAHDTLDFVFRLPLEGPEGDVFWDPCNPVPMVRLEVNAGTLDSTWWDMGNGTSIPASQDTFTYAAPGSYVLVLNTLDTVCNVVIKGDPLLVEWLATDDDLQMPNVFTPNGDGMNEVFAPLPSTLVRTARGFTLKVYTRWGQEIFVGTETGWNGTFEGTDAGAGVYYWLVELEDGCGQTRSYSGFVHLMK